MTLTFPTNFPADAKYYKVDGNGFYEFAGAVINGNTVTLTLTDDGSRNGGDSNGVADDGMIDDPGGVAVSVNNPPSSPNLVSPLNGQQGLPTTVTLEWKPVTDPDGDPVTYDLYYCEDNDPFNNCTSVQVASLEEKTDKPFYAGYGYGGGMILFGIVFAAGFRDRKRIGLLTVMLIFTGALLVSCGSHSGGDDSNYKTYTVTGLNSGAVYYWGVTAKDDQGA